MGAINQKHCLAQAQQCQSGRSREEALTIMSVRSFVASIKLALARACEAKDTTHNPKCAAREEDGPEEMAYDLYHKKKKREDNIYLLI